MIKASEGGGGKGIRKVTNVEELKSNFESVQGEVPGSPIFLMKLVSNCHHLEVQVVGDEHGNAISIYGRDCSVQRRHQKIIEEGPPIAAEPKVWKTMEKAAVRLAKAVKYVGAGTVEYLYVNGEYYFLELNPRLQVEHPVSEQIAKVNLPAIQLNVAMGIPLDNIPDIRQMYGKEDIYGTGNINFDEDEQVPPHGHVIACRITAENPHEGFKPTSGNIKELTFRSTPSVWGYFSVQSKGGLHEFADSQFGHLFSWGETRDKSRKNMIIALKELCIRGDIRTPVEYLIDLLETNDFKENLIHTGWLDELLTNKTNIQQKPLDTMIVVLCGASFKAQQLFNNRKELFMNFIEKGQVPPSELLKCDDKFEIIYDDIKYIFSSFKFGENQFFLSTLPDCSSSSSSLKSSNNNIETSRVEVEISVLPDNGFLIVVNGQSNLVYAEEEASGLRLTIQGRTCIFPKEYDPSNLRSTTAGKLVRYLVKDGQFIKAGTPYAEIEVMKMYMPLVCPESGVIHFQLSVGSVLIGGESIATLDLENPNAIKRATVYDKYLPSLKPPRAEKTLVHHKLRNIISDIDCILNGYPNDQIQFKVQELIQLTLNPYVPFYEFSEILSVLSSRLPESISEKIAKILDAYELTLKSNNLSDSTDGSSPSLSNNMNLSSSTFDQSNTNVIPFPSESILSVIQSHIKTIKKDIDQCNQFNTITLPIVQLANKYIHGHLKQLVHDFLDKYLQVENLFQQRQRDDVFNELRHKFKDNFEAIFQTALSRNSNSKKGELIVALFDLIVCFNTEDYVEKLQEFSMLSVKDCIEVSVKARQLLIRYQLPSFKQRQVKIEDTLRIAIRDSKQKMEKIKELTDQSASIFDVLLSFFSHSNEDVRHLALEIYVRRCYKAYELFDIQLLNDNDLLRAEWTFKSPNLMQTPEVTPRQSSNDNNNNQSESAASSSTTDKQDDSSLTLKPKSKSHIRKAESIDNFLAAEKENYDVTRYGSMVVVEYLDQVFDQFSDIIELFKPPFTHIGSEPLNILNISVLKLSSSSSSSSMKSSANIRMIDQQNLISRIGKLFYDHSKELRELGMRRITIVIARGSNFPEYFTFRERLNYQEDPVCRHIEPPLAYHLEMNRLSNYDITFVPTLNRQVHLYYATAKGKKIGDPDFSSCFFVRAVVRSGSGSDSSGSTVNDYLISQAERVLVDAIKSLEVAVRDKKYQSAENHHIFLSIITEVAYAPENVDPLLRTLGETYGRRLWKLKVGKLELAGKVKRGNSVTALRFIVTNPTGYDFEVEGYLEVKDNKTNNTILSSFMGKPTLDQKSVLEPYKLPDPIQRKRFQAQNHATTYCYDFPSLYKVAIKSFWEEYEKTLQSSSSSSSVKIPSCFMECNELIIDSETGKLVTVDRQPGLNDIGMVAWKLKLFTPEAPNGREIILIANDITVQIGSFGPLEDQLFMEASKLAREEKIPRIYIACNSGARIGLANEVKKKFKVEWNNSSDPTKGFKYLKIDDKDFEKLMKSNSILCCNDDHQITDIIGKDDGLGVENLKGSGMIAGETSRAYEEIFTITHVTGRTVGIGAYLVRLGQRTIQTEAPIILTGASAINKLLGKEVYSSNIQLGGLQIMFHNGVSHLDVIDDFKGTLSIIKWLSYIPIYSGLQGPILSFNDPIDREIEFMPQEKTPYNPIHLLAGYVDSKTNHWVSGFFDKNSFTETLAGWAKTVICGRARLGGIPIGVISVETRTVENIIPADPANPESQEQIQMQAGQVWFPDSAYKTAQAISDFNYGEGLPLIIFANWRGFSGGMRDMYNEILKYGSYIVDNLRKYRNPVLIYIPPFGELRGGAWVVLDPTINPEKMEMYCDSNGRGGVLEPNGTIEIKFRKRDIIATMHRLDDVILDLLKKLDNELDEQQQQVFKAQIASREEELYPVYHQIAIQFADLHDTPGRMKTKGVIRQVIQWKNARTYFYYRLKRLLAEDNIRKRIQKVQPDVTHQQETQILKACVSNDVWESDQGFINWSENPISLDEQLNTLQAQRIRLQLYELYSLDPKMVESTLKELRKK